MRALRGAVVALFALGVLGVLLVSIDEDDDEPAVAPAPTVAVVTTTSVLAAPTTSTARRAPATTTTAYNGPVTRIRGRVVDEAGRPVPGVEVGVAADEGLAGIGRVIAGVASLGTYCAGSQPPLACRDSGRATTGPDGAYTVELRASPEELRDTKLVVAASRAGSSVRRPVVVSGPTVQAADLPLWDPGFRLEGGRASWRPVPAADARYTLRLTATDRTKEELAVFYPTEPAVAFDPRVLEDFEATVSLSAVAGDFGFGAAERTVRGPGAPPTRDRPCTLVPDDPDEQPKHYDRCPVADADFFGTRLDARPSAHALVLDVGASRSFDFAVVRYFDDDPLVVEVSEDGSAWVELLRMGPRNVPHATRAWQAPQPRSGRYVRFRSEERLTTFFAVRAVAVW